jgi:hypothetical protein
VYWLDRGVQPPASVVGAEAAVLSRLRGQCRIPRSFCAVAPPLIVDPQANNFLLTQVRRLAAPDDRPTAVDIRIAPVPTATGEVAPPIPTAWVSRKNVSPDAAVAAVAEFLAQHRARPTRRLAVVAQEFIEPDAGVLVCSSVPERLKEKAILVKSTRGAHPGESQPGTSDVYLLRREDLSILVAWRAEEQEWAPPRAVGGTGLPGRACQGRSRRPGEGHIREMVEVGLAAELLMGRAVQVELAWRDGTPYALWCSPVPPGQR